MLETISVSFAIPLAYIAIGLAILGVVGFSLLQMFRDLKGAKTAFIGIGIAVAIFLLCFLLTDNRDFSIKEITVAAGTMRFVEAAIFMFYMLLVGAVIAICYSSVSRYFK